MKRINNMRDQKEREFGTVRDHTVAIETDVNHGCYWAGELLAVVSGSGSETEEDTARQLCYSLYSSLYNSVFTSEATPTIPSIRLKDFLAYFILGLLGCSQCHQARSIIIQFCTGC